MRDWKPENIEQFRRDFWLTRKSLAEMLGISVSHVYKIEKGLARPGKTIMLLLSHLEGHLVAEREKDEKGHF